jgi:hypothetical protein
MLNYTATSRICIAAILLFVEGITNKPPEQSVIIQLLKKFHVVFKSEVCHSHHKNPSSIQFTAISPKINLMLSHIHLYLQRDLFPYGFPTTILFAIFVSPVNVTDPLH